MIPALFVLIVGYMVGSIQPGLIVGRLWGGLDVREYGSGKTGFTNTLRTIGLVPALIVVAGDIGKGALPVLVGHLVFESSWAATLGGVGAVIGHTWPVFAGFRGGRGVATSFGAFFAMAPLAATVAILSGLVILGATRYVSLMSMIGTGLGLAAMVVFVYLGRLSPEYLVFGVVVTASVEFNHLGNLRRLLSGTEPKLGQGGVPRAPGTA
ncbi:MAG: glycerol-3-phosphate 1-O-acyltransferase [Chloroflexi bacterium]|nr:MAG: glycerol-3-phosphate 1-O-acyltransferase [Chloroflexota bacterium]